MIRVVHSLCAFLAVTVPSPGNATEELLVTDGDYHPLDRPVVAVVARSNDDGTDRCDDHSSVCKMSRKRGRNVQLWSRMKRKVARQHGRTYSTAIGTYHDHSSEKSS